MPIQNTPTSFTQLFPVKTGTSTGTYGVQLNPKNPGAPNLVDDEGRVFATWSATNKTFQPLSGSGSGQSASYLNSDGSAITIGSLTGSNDPTPVGAFLTQNKSVFEQNTTRIINKLSPDQQNAYRTSNVYQPYTTWKNSNSSPPPTPTTAGNGGGNAGGGSTAEITDLNNDTLKEFNATLKSKASTSKETDLIYPLEFPENGDYIKFTALIYTPRTFGSTAGVMGARDTLTSAGGTVKIAMQNQLSDSNAVSWNEDKMNALDIAGADISIGGITGGAEGFRSAFQKALETGTKGETSKQIQDMLALFFAGQAINKQNLATRLTGAVLNPNLELLFQGPSLRPFTFTFKFSPREPGEARNVINIIRWFKKNMAVQRTEGDLFLKTPNVFDISYGCNGKDGHKGLNKIKTCALQSCNVDYTPDGSYMSFAEDDTNSMVSYGLTLQFMELEPIYYDEYKNLDQIEY